MSVDVGSIGVWAPSWNWEGDESREAAAELLDDAADARELARARVGPYLELPNYLNDLRRLGFTEQDFVGGGSDRLIDAVVAWGDADVRLRHGGAGRPERRYRLRG